MGGMWTVERLSFLAAVGVVCSATAVAGTRKECALANLSISYQLLAGAPQRGFPLSVFGCDYGDRWNCTAKSCTARCPPDASIVTYYNVIRSDACPTYGSDSYCSSCQDCGNPCNSSEYLYGCVCIPKYIPLIGNKSENCKSYCSATQHPASLSVSKLTVFVISGSTFSGILLLLASAGIIAIWVRKRREKARQRAQQCSDAEGRDPDSDTDSDSDSGSTHSRIPLINPEPGSVAPSHSGEPSDDDSVQMPEPESEHPMQIGIVQPIDGVTDMSAFLLGACRALLEWKEVDPTEIIPTTLALPVFYPVLFNRRHDSSSALSSSESLTPVAWSHCLQTPPKDLPCQVSPPDPIYLEDDNGLMVFLHRTEHKRYFTCRGDVSDDVLERLVAMVEPYAVDSLPSISNIQC